MTERIKGSPVAFSVILTFVLTTFWVGTTFFARGLSEQLGSQMSLLLSSAINILFAAFAITLFGKVNQINGFKHIFKVKGLVKGLLVLIPVMAFFIFNMAFNASRVASADVETAWIFPAIAFMQTTSAFLANVLFRGLLITALFIKLSGTEKERVRSVFKASVLYLLIYIPLNIVNGNHIEPMQLINTFVVGAGFCAAYMYSRNLLSLVLIQGVWQISGAVIALFAVDVYSQFSPLVLIPLIIILISIVIFAVRFSKRAEPFLI